MDSRAWRDSISPVQEERVALPAGSRLTVTYAEDLAPHAGHSPGRAGPAPELGARPPPLAAAATGRVWCPDCKEMMPRYYIIRDRCGGLAGCYDCIIPRGQYASPR